MTAPLTPPHRPAPHDTPWNHPHPAPHPDGEGLEMRSELRRAAVVLVAVTLTGIALGLLWLWLAPKVPLISTDKAVFFADTEGEEAAGADGTFVLLALGFGVLSAAVTFWFNRRGGIAIVAALALGGILASALAWGTGYVFGPEQDVVAHARAVGQGVVFDAPLRLRAKGALLAWPLAAMVMHLALTALFAPRDPEPEWPPLGPEHQG
ncbi:ABC transporter permease [Streptomyces sp. NPDC096153]|uniref:ABC transporter permease n=1 Tax=Streptomyces sp. NPDC096153 TaxID=3155548 RepID=UPI0033233A04